MSANIVIVIVIGVLIAAGVALLLERSLTRVLMGVILIGNGANLVIALGGRRGEPPIVGVSPDAEMSDPLPQALMLTSIVITLGFTAFLLAMAYRTWQLTGHDEVQDDVEDRRIEKLAEQNRASRGSDELGGGFPEVRAGDPNLAGLLLRQKRERDTE